MRYYNMTVVFYEIGIKITKFITLYIVLIIPHGRGDKIPIKQKISLIYS